MELIPWFPEKALTRDEDPALEKGFVINHSSHWFAIRNIGGVWWNLNSTNKCPQLISTFYLSAFLSQLAQDGYSVFLARGPYPTSNQHKPDGSPYWHNMCRDVKSKRSSDAPPLSAPYQGQAHKLGSGSQEIGYSLPPGVTSFDDASEDEQLAIALSLSLQEEQNTKQNATGGKVMTEKELIREKRLAALGK
jgi:hypothetical protein